MKATYSMHVGDRVVIYSDPFTRQNPEEEVVLIKLLKAGPPDYPGAQRWRVRFNDGEVCDRWI
ncbi:MAG: hypothetical protein MN733_10445 [Nitrososphaera sp.]|nr:hypothetical protein [Nitrososphaera sp.]